MSKNRIIEDLKNDNKSGYKTKKNYIMKNYPSDYNEIIKISFTENWNEKLYCYVNNITEKRVCLNANCNKHVKFFRYSKGYYGYCSTKCKNIDPIFIEKNKEIFLKKYGVDNIAKLSSTINKTKQTKKERYDNENYCNLKKSNETKERRYGDRNYNNRKKAIKTTLEKFGKKNNIK